MSETTEKKIEEFVTRPYQQAIIDTCIQRNSIVYLPTGAGKSYIAIQVIKHFSQALETKYSIGGKLSIFLVNTVCLAKQQAETLEKMLPFKVALVCGESGVDYWTEKEWTLLLDNHEIIVATSQVIVDAVKHSFLKLEQVNVLIFDECHHGTKDHPYKELMKMFETKKDTLPMENIRIVGLSGMLIGNDNKITQYSVAKDLQSLESVFRSTIVTVNNLDHLENALTCSTKAKESLVTYKNEPCSSIVAVIDGILMTMVAKLQPIKIENYQSINPKSLRPTGPKKVKDLVALLKDFGCQAAELGPFGGYLSLLSSLVQLELNKRFCDSEKFRDVVKSCITVVEKCISMMKASLGLHQDSREVIFENSSFKVRQLIGLLKMSFNDPDHEKDLQCLVFVKRRSTSKILYHILKAYAKHDKDFQVIPDFMVGMNAQLTESIDSILNNSFLSLTLEKFKNKETNCIVSTDVLEEGIDLQMCNLVVAFEAPATYRSFVQARGRARVDKSNYVVLINETDKSKFEKNVLKWRSIDMTMKSQLHLKTIDRKAPTEEDMQEQHNNFWEPFITPISGSVLNSMNCVSLLNHYASTMPSDKFTNVSVIWERCDLEGRMISVSLELPSQSVIQEKITGDPKSGIRMAKQHAAFKACKMLYEAGELDDNLVPVKEEQKVELVQDDYFTHWKAEKYANDSKKAGTRNHRRYHEVKSPKVLLNSGPQAGELNFLYRIIVRPKFKTEGKKSLEKFYKLIGNENEFGILTSRRFPKLCKMTLFQTFGEVEVEISDVPMAVKLEDEKKLKILQDFHSTVFRDVLQCCQTYFVLDKTSYLIVPLTECAINWSLAAEFNKVHQPKRLSYDELLKAKFTRKEYQDRVINPVYRDEGMGLKMDRKYVVIEVREDMTPMSPFPNEGYNNFKEYVEERFNVTVRNTDQPMIEVKGISKSLNHFFPGGGETGKQRKHEKQHLTEFYIPELCHNYQFPADYWLKATLLPSICHRIHYMLLAEELRMWLITEGIDKGNRQQNYKLDVDYGDYDQRDKSLLEIARENESFGKLPDFYKGLSHVAQSSTAEAKHRARAPLLWNRNELPTDLDRHWLTLTEVDIDYYCGFLDKNQNKVVSSQVLRLIEAKMSPKRVVPSLMDSVDRSEIRILKLDGYGPSVQQKDLIKVLTTSNAGDVFDMERHEVLGDAFLKFICSMYLFKKYPEWHEGHLTTLKGKLVSNRNLYYVGNDFGLSSIIKTSNYDASNALLPSLRMPPNLQTILESDKQLLTKLFNLEGLGQDEISTGMVNWRTLQEFQTQKGYAIEHDEQSSEDGVEKSLLPFIKQHYVGDKIIADAVEAFIGVVVGSSGIEAGIKTLQKLKILPPTENLDNLLTETIPPRVVLRNGVAVREARVQNRAELERIIGYKFKNVGYLVQALTHPSYPIKTNGTYQQLEFLGDAVLDYLVTCYITEQCTKMDPGKLTDLRSALVNNVTLACIVVRNGLHKFLLSESVLLSEATNRFVLYQSSMEHKVVLDQIVLLETEDENSIAEAIDVPKVVGDIFESIIGAVYLDCKSLMTTWKVIYGLLKQEIHEFIADVPKQIIRMLYEHNKGALEPQFYDEEPEKKDAESKKGLKSEASMVSLVINWMEDGKKDKKVFIGCGKNKSLARKCAAKLALRALKVR